MNHIPLRNFRETPEVAASVTRITTRSADGREVIDGSGGAAVACLGHGHPAVIEAIRHQIERVCYVYTGFHMAESIEELAEQLVGHEPEGLTHAYFVRSGSGAMEIALKSSDWRGNDNHARILAAMQRRDPAEARSAVHADVVGAADHIVGDIISRSRTMAERASQARSGGAFPDSHHFTPTPHESSTP